MAQRAIRLCKRWVDVIYGFQPKETAARHEVAAYLQPNDIAVGYDGADASNILFKKSARLVNDMINN
jgi:hypothetical protein